MTIRFIHQLFDDENAMRYVTGSFQLGQAIGAFPRDRDAPTGGEHCVLGSTQWGVPVGFVTFYEVGHGRAWIDLVWVDAAHRRLGLGRKMMSAVRREATELGLIRLEFGTQLDNAAMRGLAASAGFGDRFIHMSLAMGEGAR